MSQKAIREFDAKTLWSRYAGSAYPGVIVQSEKDVTSLVTTLEATGCETFVVKPDLLFGKRGKYGLVGVKLDATGVQAWIQERWKSPQKIKEVTGTLDTFVVEPFVPHEQEYYVAVKTERDHDVMYFSLEGGMEVEENREKVREIQIDVVKGIDKQALSDMLQGIHDNLTLEKIQDFLIQFYGFFKELGMAYLEVNPFVIPSPPAPLPKGEGSNHIVCLDMVARVDTCEEWKQKAWRDVKRVQPFGSLSSDFELLVEKMDAETGASLKFTTLNPDGSIALLLGSGGASVAIMDTFSARGMMDEVMNYGELSGNPNYRHNRTYIQGLFDMLYASTSQKQKYFCYLGPIANFTRIDVVGKAFVDALEEKVDKIKEQEIKIVVRRGGVNDTVGLAMIASFCKKHDVPYYVAGGEVDLTTAIDQIT